MIKKMLIGLVATAFAAGAFAQVEPAVKETGRAVSESSKEAGDNVNAAVSRDPKKSVEKSKAQVHKAKARVHRKQAKKAADSTM